MIKMWLFYVVTVFVIVFVAMICENNNTRPFVSVIIGAIIGMVAFGIATELGLF